MECERSNFSLLENVFDILTNLYDTKITSSSSCNYYVTITSSSLKIEPYFKYCFVELIILIVLLIFLSMMFKD